MTDVNEVVFISDNSETGSSVQCCDLQLGVRIKSYKSGHAVAKRTLNILGDDFLLTAEESKPFVHVWALNKEEPLTHLRMLMPGKVTALAVSPNRVYCAAGIDNKIYIWNMSSGQLLNVLVHHHEPIVKIVFCHCFYFVTIAADGLVSVWRLSDVVAKQTGDVFVSGSTPRTPFFTSAHHSLPVTDMHLGFGINNARLYTVSADQTCHVYALTPASGTLLLTLTFDYVLTSVVTDRLERKLFVGTSCGKILEFNMDPNPVTMVHHVDSGLSEFSNRAHSSAVNVLALSWEDTILASGSNDKKVILWSVATRQQVGMYEMNGFVTGIVFRMMPSDFLSRDTVKTGYQTMTKLERASERDDFEIKINVTQDLSVEESILASDDELEESSRNGYRQKDETADPEEGAEEVDTDPETESEPETSEQQNHGRFKTPERYRSDMMRLKMVNKKLRRANRKLYMFALKQIWENRGMGIPLGRRENLTVEPSTSH